MTTIRVPITKPQWPAKLSLRTAVLNQLPNDPANEPDQDPAGLDRRKEALWHQGHSIHSLLLAPWTPR